MLYRDTSVSLTPLIRGLPGASSCFAATESCVMCTLIWVLDWQSCEVSKPFDHLLLDMMMDAFCSYHFSFPYGKVPHMLEMCCLACVSGVCVFLKHDTSLLTTLALHGARRQAANVPRALGGTVVPRVTYHRLLLLSLLGC